MSCSVFWFGTAVQTLLCEPGPVQLLYLVESMLRASVSSHICMCSISKHEVLETLLVRTPEQQVPWKLSQGR